MAGQFKNIGVGCMEKGKLNVIIFEDDEQAGKEQRESRAINTSKSQQLQNNPQQYDIIQQEIQYLTEKVRQLETQTENLSLFKNDSHFSQRPSLNLIDTNTHTKDLLFAIEKKIQLIVRETKKIVDRLGESFEKKLEAKLAKKYDELGVGKIKENYSNAVKKVEEHYRKEIERVNKDYKEAEAKMMARLNEAEQKFMSKMNEFSIKEKEYVAWIHHLEIQLKEREQKSKKMIEVTQEKVASRKEQSETNSILSNQIENYSSVNHNQQQRISPLPNDASKVQRKHRIFDNKGSSVSPNKIATNSHYNNNVFQSTKIVNPAIRTKPAESSEQEQQQVTISLATKTAQTLKNNFVVENQSSPWRLIDKSTDKRNNEATGRNRVIENVREEEFYKDVPKANSGWDKFQDFKENQEESSESEEDVLFYREADQHQQFMDNFRSTKFRGEESIEPRHFHQSKKAQQKVFSPFDLN